MQGNNILSPNIFFLILEATDLWMTVIENCFYQNGAETFQKSYCTTYLYILKLFSKVEPQPTKMASH